MQPRIGIAYKPPFGNNKTVIRGGIGLFSTNYTDGIGGTLANQVPNKFAPFGLTFGTVGVITDPTSSAYTAQVSANAFQSGFNSGGTLAQIQTAVKPATFSTPSITSFPSTYLAPHTIEWSAEIQQELTAHNMFTVSYVGNHGYDLAETVNANMYASFHQHQELRSLLRRTALGAGRRPFRHGDSGLHQRHQQLQLPHLPNTAQRSATGYRPSSITPGATPWVPSPTKIRSTSATAMAVSASTTGLRQPATILWNQPFKTSNKVVNGLIADWTVGFKAYIYSGAPFSVTDSKIATDVNSSGVLTPLADLVVPTAFGMHCNCRQFDRPTLHAKDRLRHLSRLGHFELRSRPTGATLHPNSFRGPGYFDVDMTLQRGFAIKEKYKFTFGMQAYNVLNHPNFANPSGTLTSGSFGEITSTLGPPTSIYGTGQGASVSGRLVVFTGTFVF